MKKTIQIFVVKNEAGVSVPYSTNAKAVEAQETLAKFDVEVKIEKVKKVIEL